MAMYKGEAKIKDIYLGDVPIFKVYAGEEFCGFFTFSHENLVSNSDLLIDRDSNNIPDGFQYYNATDISLTNGIAKFTATAQWANFRSPNDNSFTIDDTYYVFASFKSSSSSVRLLTVYPIKSSNHSGSNEFEFHSFLTKKTSNNNSIYIEDTRSSDWTPIEVDYMGAINITDLVSRDILPSGLTDAQYKTILDNYFNS